MSAVINDDVLYNIQAHESPLGSVTSVARDLPWKRGHVASTGESAPGDMSRCSALFPRVRCEEKIVLLYIFNIHIYG